MPCFSYHTIPYHISDSIQWEPCLGFPANLPPPRRNTRLRQETNWWRQVEKKSQPLTGRSRLSVRKKALWRSSAAKCFQSVIFVEVSLNLLRHQILPFWHYYLPVLQPYVLEWKDQPSSILTSYPTRSDNLLPNRVQMQLFIVTWVSSITKLVSWQIFLPDQTVRGSVFDQGVSCTRCMMVEVKCKYKYRHP